MAVGIKLWKVDGVTGLGIIYYGGGQAARIEHKSRLKLVEKLPVSSNEALNHVNQSMGNLMATFTNA